MSKKFGIRFQYDWILYVAVALVSVSVWYFAFGLFNAPTDAETIHLFFAGKVEDNSFKTVADKAMAGYGVKTVEINSCDTSDSAFSTKYSVVALNGCDVVVVPVSVADVTDCENTFTALSGIDGGYEQNGVTYGAYIDDTVKQNLSAYFKFTDEKYVAFVVASSVNSGGDALTDNALKFLTWFIGYGKS